MLKVGYFLFFSPVSASAVINPIFDIKTTKEKTKVFTPMLPGSVKSVISFGFMDASASPKNSGGGFADNSSTSGSGGFKF